MNLFSRLRPLLASSFLAALMLVINGCSRHGSFLLGRSVWGLFILVLDVLALLEIFKQPWDLARKLLWTVLILLLPIVGLIAYYLFSGRKSA